MGRNAEYEALLSELSDTPLKLDYTVDRARPRFEKWKKRRRIKRAIGIPLGSLAALCAAFVILVNASPAFAETAKSVPWLASFADYVQFYPSLDRAADAGYVQAIGQTQTKDGITIKLDGAFSDERQINLYYTVTTDDGRKVNAIPTLYTDASDEAQNCSCELGGDNGQLMHAAWEYTGSVKPPQDCKMVMKVYERNNLSDIKNSPHTDLVFKFKLTDAAKTNWTHLGAGTSFTLGGQKFTLTDAAVSPTQTRLYVRGDPANTAYARNILFYLEDENGTRYGEHAAGTYAEGSELSGIGGDGLTFVCDDSPYFSGCKHLTLCITTVSWMDKTQFDSKTGREKPIYIDLANKTADNLPEGVSFEYAERANGGWKVGFSAPEYKGGASHSIFQDYPLDKDGKAISSTLTTSFESVELPGQRFQQHFTLNNYSADEVWLCPAFTSVREFNEPIRITVK